jgi:hypothetical protein
MTGEDTDGKAALFRHPDKTWAGIAVSFHRDQSLTAAERRPKTRRRSRIIKRDEGPPQTIPRIVVAEQWLCFLLGLICMICGVCGLFMNYNPRPAYGPILWSTTIACFVLGALLVRCGLSNPDQAVVSIGQKPWRSVRANLARASNLFSAWGKILGFGLKRKGPP